MPSIVWTDRDSGRYETAIHEAGHQVMNVALTGRAGQVEIFRDSGRSYDSSVHIRYDEFHPRYWQVLAEEIQILIAGERAVRQLPGMSDASVEQCGAVADRAALEPLLKKFADHEGRSSRELQWQFEEVADRCLTERWPFVERLASALTVEDVVFANRVAQLLRGIPSLQIRQQGFDSAPS